MFRAGVLVLVAVQTLMPPGVCVRKYGIPGWLTPADQHVQAPGVRSNTSGCCSGCAGRADRHCEADDQGCSRDPVARLADGPVLPVWPEQEPCCLAFCQTQADKLLEAEVSAPAEALPAGPVYHTLPAARPHPLSRPVAAISAPPRYVTFCTFLI